jgi:hypothetical protein
MPFHVPFAAHFFAGSKFRQNLSRANAAHYKQCRSAVKGWGGRGGGVRWSCDLQRCCVLCIIIVKVIVKVIVRVCRAQDVLSRRCSFARGRLERVCALWNFAILWCFISHDVMLPLCSSSRVTHRAHYAHNILTTEVVCLQHHALHPLRQRGNIICS